MSDLIKRLRGWPGPRGGEVPYSQTMTEAADEIEKLRAALRQIGKGDICVALLSHPPICSRAFAARAALGEKE
jgi:hypothetical protein